MPETTYYKGHAMYQDGNGEFRFCDTQERTVGHSRLSTCGFCGKPDTPEGHDGCLGHIEGLMNACCGHGISRHAYAQYPNGKVVSGPKAIALMFNPKHNNGAK